MEWGLLHDLFGNFSTRGERYLFCIQGSMQDGHDMRLLHKVRMVTRGDFSVVMGTT